MEELFLATCDSMIFLIITERCIYDRLYDTVSVDVPELVLWIVSPKYFAVIVMEPDAKGAVYVTLHWLLLELIGAKVQVPLLKLPPKTLAFHDTVPVGAIFVPRLVSVTVAVNIVLPPRLDDAGFGDTVVDVVLSTVNNEVPELA